MRRCGLYSMIAVTPVHVGVGRSPGVVDLPIARDGFGLPFVPASSLKGVMRSLCALQTRDADECSRLYGPDVDRVADNAYLSPLIFTDAYLILYPARIEDGSGTVFAYITSRLALARLGDLASLCTHASRCRGLQCLVEAIERVSTLDGVEVEVNGVKLEAAPVRGCLRSLLDTVAGATRLSRKLAEGGVYVIGDDEAFLEAVEAGILRHTRVRLDYHTKTVERGALWTEEYMSQGAVLAYALLAREGRETRPEDLIRRYEQILEDVGWHVTVGGKETIGKGIVKISRVDERRGGAGVE